MARPLRALLLGSIALAFVYLIVHARQPLRLNIGDAWSDASVVASVNGDVSAPSFITNFYRAVGTLLGASDIGTLRLFALAWSGLAMWLLFSYVRRLYSERVALIATALFSTSRMWMMYADSIHHVPIMTAMMFLGLWGLVRAIETTQRRFYAAAFVGSFAAFFTSSECFIFLPAAVLVTIYLKLGNPFARGNRRFVTVCAAACMLAVVVKSLATINATGWDAFVAALETKLFTRTISHSSFQVESPTLVRRLTLAFTPLFWLAAGCQVLEAIRAPKVGAAIKETAAWMLLAAVVFLVAFPRLSSSQMLALQTVLPFYAIGSALVVDRLLERTNGWRHCAVAWLVAAPLWAFSFFVTHRPSLLARSDVAKTQAYLAAHDHNDFVLSNLTSDAPIHAAFQRHGIVFDAGDPYDAVGQMLLTFESTGADSVHELVFADRDSRFLDGSSYVHTARAEGTSADYEERVKKNLEAVGATEVLALRNYSVYHIDRAAVMAQLGKAVAAADRIAADQIAATRHLLLGWTDPYMMTPQIAVTSIVGFERCQVAHTTLPGNRCKTIDTKSGTRPEAARPVFAAQLMIRVDRVCDLRLTFAFAADSDARFSINGVTVTRAGGRTVTFTVPAANVTAGINVIEIEPLLPRWIGLHLESLDVAPECAAFGAPAR